MDKNSQIHENHRERMRQKFKKSPQSISDHELLEMLLYYSIPRINTNESAHRLLKLGKNSIKGVFELDSAQIKSIDGLGEKSAEYISLIKETFNRIEKEKISNPKIKKLTTQNIKSFLIGEFLGYEKEMFLMISVDVDCNILNKHIISIGSESSSMVSIKEIVRNAVTDKAKYVFAAHNHPNGLLVPSDSDINLTKAVCEALALVEIPVIEHYIVTNKDCVGIIKSCNLFGKRKNG